MSIADIIILIVVILILAAVIYARFIRKGRSRCSGCPSKKACERNAKNAELENSSDQLSNANESSCAGSCSKGCCGCKSHSDKNISIMPLDETNSDLNAPDILNAPIVADSDNLDAEDATNEDCSQ